MAASTVFVLFQTDEHHTNASRLLIGVFSSQWAAVDYLGEWLEAHGEPPLSPEDKRLIEVCNQTQNYTGSGEFLIQPETIDNPSWTFKF